MPIPVSVVSGDLVAKPAPSTSTAEGTDPDGAVLLDQSAQLGDQHPRPGRAVRADQRRHRAGRRPVHRRRVLRASGRRRRSTSSTSSGSKCCADRRARSSARTPPPARSTSRPASPRFTPGTDFELNYGNIGFVQAKASVTGPLGAEGRRAAVVLRHPARRHRLQRHDAGRRERSEQSGRQGQVLFAPSDRIAITAAVDHTRQRAGGLHAGRRRRRADAAAGEPAVPADRRRPRLHAAELQRLRSADRRRHAAAVLPGSRRRVAERRLEARTAAG